MCILCLLHSEKQINSDRRARRIEYIVLVLEVQSFCIRCTKVMYWQYRIHVLQSRKKDIYDEK